MTIAMGIKFGDYVLLAADTLTTDLNGRVIDDDSVKIQKTSYGLITGAGFLGLLNSVKYELSQQTITSNEQIVGIIREETERCQSRHGEYAKQYIEKTGWIFSYKTDNGGIPKLNLAMAHPDFGEKLIEIYGEQDPAVIWPIEATEEQAKRIGDILREEIKPFEQADSIEGNLKHNCAAAARAIQRCAKFPSVSSDYQIGVHSIEHGRAVSPIVKDTRKTISLDFDFCDC